MDHTKVFFCPVWMCLYLFGLIFSQIWESQKSHLCLFKLILFLNYENSFKISVLLIVIFFVFSLNLLPTTENHDWCAKIKRCTTNWEVEKLNTKDEERATIDHLVVLMPGSIFFHEILLRDDNSKWWIPTQPSVFKPVGGSTDVIDAPFPLRIYEWRRSSFRGRRTKLADTHSATKPLKVHSSQCRGVKTRPACKTKNRDRSPPSQRRPFNVWRGKFE